MKLLVILALLAAFVAFVVNRMKSAAATMAQASAQIREWGISVTETERELPVYGGSGNNLTIDEMVKTKCLRYAMRRTHPGPEWEMLQRDKAAGAQLPNDYLVRGSGNLDQILERLTPVAKRMNEDVFEAEATKTEVAVYFDHAFPDAAGLRALLQSIDF
jgi:hypothetical protein